MEIPHRFVHPSSLCIRLTLLAPVHRCTTPFNRPERTALSHATQLLINESRSGGEMSSPEGSSSSVPQQFSPTIPDMVEVQGGHDCPQQRSLSGSLT